VNAEPNVGVKLVLPFDAIGRDALPVVGGKAANLGEMARAGLSVPAEFCVTSTLRSFRYGLFPRRSRERSSAAGVIAGLNSPRGHLNRRRVLRAMRMDP